MSALIATLSHPESAEGRLQEVSRETITTAREAELVVRLLKLFPLPPDPSAKRAVFSELHIVLSLMQGARDQEAIAVFREHGGHELLRIFDETLQVASRDAESGAKSDLLFLLKVICRFAPEGGLERLVTAARSPMLRDGYLWSPVFNAISKTGHPWHAAIVEALRDPLPAGFVGVAYLDLSNTILRSGELVRHPFDTEAGLVLLQGWLLDEENPSYGHSAAASIPFLSPEARVKVRALADQHHDRGVQLEAAWAAAACGDARGFRTLQTACLVPQEASTAMQYLAELGAEDRIPLQARSDDFKAISEMCRWLAHPMEFGRPPQAIRQVDTRELFWPPTNDQRRLWVFRFDYAGEDGQMQPQVGYGMVGSVTFALAGESTPDLSVEQVYGLHCAWELEVKRDARAPLKRTAEAGIQILKEYNPGFG